MARFYILCLLDPGQHCQKEKKLGAAVYNRGDKIDQMNKRGYR